MEKFEFEKLYKDNKFVGKINLDVLNYIDPEILALPICKECGVDLTLLAHNTGEGWWVAMECANDECFDDEVFYQYEIDLVLGLKEISYKPSELKDIGFTVV